MKRASYYFLAGIFFLFLQGIAIMRNILIDYIYFFWFCDFIPLLLAIGFFLRDDQMVKGIINIGLIPQLIYFVSAFVAFIFGVSFFKGVEFLLGVPLEIILLTLMFHASTLFAIILVPKFRPSKVTIYYSLLALALIYIVVLLFSNPADNANYIFDIGGYFGVSISSAFWIPIVLLLFVLPTQGIQYLIGLFYERKNKYR